ncbi:MAG: CDP-alcohol phosphatidyltransferase family protein [Candidatus Korarchaeum sp.]
MLERFRGVSSKMLEGLAYIANSIGVSANFVTFLGFLSFLGSSISLLLKRPLLASALIMLGGFFDLMDGAIARKSGNSGPKGAFIDSVTDRVEDGLLFVSMGIYSDELLWAALATHSSMLVSYVRARSESLGVRGTEFSLAGRGERILLSALFCAIDMVSLGLTLIALLSYVTCLERSYIFFRELKKRG